MNHPNHVVRNNVEEKIARSKRNSGLEKKCFF